MSSNRSVAQAYARRQDPAPALTRGLELLALLAADGQSSLEALARKTGWPKSSVWRYLQALEALCIVRQDPESKHWEALQTLKTIDQGHCPKLEKARRRLAVWAKDTHCCVELYHVREDRLILFDRAEPEDDIVSVRARIGFQRDLSELEATALIYFAFQSKRPPKGASWVWHEGRRLKIGDRAAHMRIDEVRKAGWARDNDFNEYGFRRFARPVFEDGRLVGVAAIAQRLTPLAEREKSQIVKMLNSEPNL